MYVRIYDGREIHREKGRNDEKRERGGKAGRKGGREGRGRGGRGVGVQEGGRERYHMLAANVVNRVKAAHFDVVGAVFKLAP